MREYYVHDVQTCTNKHVIIFMFYFGKEMSTRHNIAMANKL